MALARIEISVGHRGQASARGKYISRDGREVADRVSVDTVAYEAIKVASEMADYIGRTGRFLAADGEILEATGSGNMPKWAHAEPRKFWAAADEHERERGQTFRQAKLTLPRELNAAQRLELTHAFIRAELGIKHPYEFAIHNKIASDGGEQPHAHVMWSDRQQDGIERGPAHFFKRAASRYRHRGTGELLQKDPATGGARKSWGPPCPEGFDYRKHYSQLLTDLRARWENLVNQALERAQRPERVDLRSRAARELPGSAERKMGPLAANDPEVQALTRTYRSLRGEAEERQAAARAEREQSGAQALELTPAEGFAPTLRMQLGAIYGAQPEQDSLGLPVGPGRQPPQRPEGVPARARVGWSRGGGVRLESTDGGVVIDHGDRMVGVHGTADEAAIMAAIVAARRWRQMEAQAEDEVALQRVRKALRAVGAELAAPRSAVAPPAPSPARQPIERVPEQAAERTEPILMHARSQNERTTWRQRYRARLLQQAYGDLINPDDAWLRQLKWVDVRLPHAGEGRACLIQTHRGSRLIDSGGEVLAAGNDPRDVAVALVRMARLKGWTDIEIGEGPDELRQQVLAELRPMAERAGLKVFDPAAEQVRPSAIEALQGREQQGLDAARDAGPESGDEVQEEAHRSHGPRGPGMGR